MEILYIKDESNEYNINTVGKFIDKFIDHHRVLLINPLLRNVVKWSDTL